MFPRPTLTPRLKTAFPWYPAPQYRARHTQMCEEVAERCPWPILMPNRTIIPFQFVAGTGASFGNSYPTAWLVKNLQGETVRDLSDYIPSLELTQFAMPNRDVITLPTELTILNPPLPRDTCLEMEIVTPGGTYYSETFKVWGDCIQSMHLLTWRSCGDFGTIHYKDTAFTNYLYLDPETNFLRNPSPALNLEDEKRADGSSVEVFKRKETTWTLQMAPIPWHVLDAITEIPLHDNVTLKLGEDCSLTPRNTPDQITNVAVSFTWQDECRALPELTFNADPTYATGCCGAFVPACPSPCVTADGVEGIHPLEVGKVYLRTGQRGYATYGEDGFGPLTPCPYGYARIDSGSVNVWMVFVDSEWTALLPITVEEIECEQRLVRVISIIPVSSFSVGVETSSDGVAWERLEGTYTTDEMPDGIEVELPEGAVYLRIVLIGPEGVCEVVAESHAYMVPCE